MKRILKIIGVLILLLLLFRGWIYRSFVNYKVVGNRPVLNITNQELIDKIESQTKSKKIDPESIVNIANSISIETLSFTNKQKSNNPNELFKSKKANCIGYAAMFSAVANYLIQKNNLQKDVVIHHQIGKLDLLGFDLHQYFNSPFFKDHDFNQLRILKTNEVISIDASVSDYLGISRVSSSNTIK